MFEFNCIIRVIPPSAQSAIQTKRIIVRITDLTDYLTFADFGVKLKCYHSKFFKLVLNHHIQII